MKWESYAHPISDIRDWNKQNRLELQPDFQRNEVWSKSGQIMLIDTILRNIPIPKLYIQSEIKEDNTFRIVIDGQQRLRSILLFLNDELTLESPYDGEYYGMKFSELPPETKKDILRYKIDINEINSPTELEIRDLYARVNKYTVQLNKQELRKADFPGDFIKLSEELSELSFFNDSKIFSVKMRRRMLDVEYIEELLILLVAGPQGKKESIDLFCENYANMGVDKDVYRRKFRLVISDIEQIFDESFSISKTRFKQKADFYTVFGCIVRLHKEGYHLVGDKLIELQDSLRIINEEIAPHSEVVDYRDYAMRCLSDANSINTRKWRENFLIDKMRRAYEKGGI